MNKLRLLLKYLEPYKWSAFRNILYNILSALFALFSYTMVIPFLKIMFNRMEPAPYPGEFQLNAEYLSAAARYYMTSLIDKHGETTALLLVCLVVVVASLFKNGFIFLANNSMALEAAKKEAEAAASAPAATEPAEVEKAEVKA